MTDIKTEEMRETARHAYAKGLDVEVCPKELIGLLDEIEKLRAEMLEADKEN